MNKKLLTALDYQLINQLNLVARRRMSGWAFGEQNSPARGDGIEFADYREYQPGDDIRRVDWAVFLRLRRLLIRLCAEEKELTLLVILDISRSMQFGTPDKLWLTRQIAAILAGIALRDGNRAGVMTMGKQLEELFSRENNQVSLAGVVNALERIQPVNKIDPKVCIRQFASRYSRKCMAVMISDFLFPEWSQVITGLAATGCESYIIHMMAPQELNPPLLGEVTLVDSESLGEMPLHVDYALIDEYRKVLDDFLQDIRQTCGRLGVGYSLAVSDIPLAGILHRELRKGGLLC
jgi:uncharacterized protein (DUF58 family)